MLSFFFSKQKTAYEMRISDWSSDVCSSDLLRGKPLAGAFLAVLAAASREFRGALQGFVLQRLQGLGEGLAHVRAVLRIDQPVLLHQVQGLGDVRLHPVHVHRLARRGLFVECVAEVARSEEHTSELQSLMRISYAVFCLKKK